MEHQNQLKKGVSKEEANSIKTQLEEAELRLNLSKEPACHRAIIDLSPLKTQGWVYITLMREGSGTIHH